LFWIPNKSPPERRLTRAPRVSTLAVIARFVCYDLCIAASCVSREEFLLLEQERKFILEK